MNFSNFIPAILSSIIGLASFYFAIRGEMKRNTEKLMKSKLDDEIRHNLHEKRLAIIEEKLSFLDNVLKLRLDEINNRISELSRFYIEHLREGHL